MSLEHTIAHDLLSIGAVFLRPDEPFTWASGIKSPIYCDNRLTLTAPAVRTHVEEGLVALICKHYPAVEVRMGPSAAGIAPAAHCGPRCSARTAGWCGSGCFYVLKGIVIHAVEHGGGQRQQLKLIGSRGYIKKDGIWVGHQL